MLLKFLASATAFAVLAGAQAQSVAQALSATIVTDSWTRNDVLVTVSPGSTISGTKWLDIRCEFQAACWPLMGIPSTSFYGDHTYDGYIRCKWVGAGTPSPLSNYGAIFKCWALVNGKASVTMIKPQPGPRSLLSYPTIGNVYLPLLPLFAAASNGSDFDAGGDLTYTTVMSEPLPSVGNNGNWNAMGDYATAAPFNLEPDGFYYAYFHVVGVTQFTDYIDGTSTNGYNTLDVAGSGYMTRMAFQLVEVNTQPVL